MQFTILPSSVGYQNNHNPTTKGAIKDGFDQTLEYPKDQRDELAAICLPHWKQNVAIMLRKGQDDYDTRAAGQPTHDYLTAASRYGYPTQIELLTDGWQLCDATCTPIK